MFILKFKLTRNRVLVVLCALIALAAIIIHLCTYGSMVKSGKTAQQRQSYLQELGYSVKSEKHIGKLVIPAEFDKVYASYNDMQQKAGFDLSRYKGLEVELYNYPLKSFAKSGETIINLYVYGGKIIGGDITNVGENGFCLPLVKAEENLKEIG